MIIFSIMFHLILKINLYSLSTDWLGNKRKQTQNYGTVMDNLHAENGQLSVLHIANSLTLKYYHF